MWSSMAPPPRTPSSLHVPGNETPVHPSPSSQKMRGRSYPGRPRRSPFSFCYFFSLSETPHPDHRGLPVRIADAVVSWAASSGTEAGNGFPAHPPSSSREIGAGAALGRRCASVFSGELPARATFSRLRQHRTAPRLVSVTIGFIYAREVRTRPPSPLFFRSSSPWALAIEQRHCVWSRRRSLSDKRGTEISFSSEKPAATLQKQTRPRSNTNAAEVQWCRSFAVSPRARVRVPREAILPPNFAFPRTDPWAHLSGAVEAQSPPPTRHLGASMAWSHCQPLWLRCRK